MRAKALVAGANGIVGGNIAEHLAREGWDVVGLSRSAPRRDASWRTLRVDLGDAAAVREALGTEPGVTHLFHAARAPRADPAEEAAVNLALLTNLMEPLAASGSFAHACLVHGTKWYGSHLGPFRTPAREDDPPHLPPNFYVDQARWLEQRQPGASWTWSTLRPGVVCGWSLGYPHNIAAVLATYAAICRELGLPLRFPGSAACFDAVSQATDARLLARAAAWAGSDPRCANQSFNIVNGDLFRWRHLWERLARHFGMENGGVQTVPLARFMADKEPLWRSIVERNGLRPFALADIVDWQYADMTFRQDWDHISSTTKARRFGFHDFVETEEMFIEHVERYRAERIVP